MFRKYDLLIIIGLSVFHLVLVLLGVTGIVRVASGFIFVALLPGYSLLATLYKPYRQDFNHLEQVALAVPTSIAVSAILSLLFNSIGMSTQADRYALWQCLLTCAPAVARLLKQDTGQHLGHDFAVIVAGVLVVSLGVGIVATNIASHTDTEVVSLYLLDAKGQTADYPVNVSAGAPVQVRIGVSYQGVSVQQFQLVSPDGERSVLTLQPGQTWEKTVSIDVGQKGLRQVAWNLSGTASNAINRSVHLWVKAQ
jgi:uncharacterized membrane protein